MPLRKDKHIYRDNRQVFTGPRHNFILNHGALGDVITSLPALVFARQFCSEEFKLRVFVAPWQVELISHLLKPYGTFDVRDMNEVPTKMEDRIEAWPDEQTSMNAPVANTHTRNRVHMVDFAFNYLIDARPENMAQRNYPTAAPLGPRVIPDKYVVIPVGATSDNKLFKASVMTPVLEWLLENNYLPVLVGTKVSHTTAEMGDGTREKITIRCETDVVPKTVIEACRDMREKTTLLELRDLLGHSEATVGIDGGSVHLAGTTDTNILYAMGTTKPEHRYIARHANPNHKVRYVIPRDLQCAGCQSNMHLTRWDFRHCVYGDNLCMEKLHPEDFINGLKEMLNA